MHTISKYISTNHTQLIGMIFRLQFNYEIRAVNVGNITQSNNGRTRLTEKTNIK